MMDGERRTERAVVVWDSDATCPCGADPKADDSAAIDDESRHMDMFPQAARTVLARGPLPEVPVDDSVAPICLECRR